MKAKLAVIPLLVLLLAGCKEKNDFNPPEFEASYLHVVGASSMVDTFSVIFDYYNVDDVVISKYFHLKNWPISGYADLTAGGVPDEFGNGKLYIHTIKYNSPVVGQNDTLISKKDIILNPDERSTLCLTDSSGEMILVKFADEFQNPPAAGMVNVRFINLKESVPSGTLSSTDGTLSIGGIGFLNASGFVQIPAGTYTIEAHEDAGGSVIGSSPNIFLYEGGTFTFFLTSPGSLGSFAN